MDINNAIEVRNMTKYFKVEYDKAHTLKERLLSFGKSNREVHTCLLYTSLNVKHLKDELLDYINNPQKLETLNNNAMKHLKELSWEKSAQQFSNIINDLKQ